MIDLDLYLMISQPGYLPWGALVWCLSSGAPLVACAALVDMVYIDHSCSKAQDTSTMETKRFGDHTFPHSENFSN